MTIEQVVQSKYGSVATSGRSSDQAGVKAIAEIPIDGMAPAVANAVADALGVRVHQIPLTPERVLRAIRGQGA